MKNLSLPPCDTRAFQNELNLLCRGENLQLRIAWSPALTVAKVIGVNGRPVVRQYAKYPLVGNHVKPFLIGHRFFRQVNGVLAQTGYQKVGGVVTGNVLPTDVAEPDYETINYAAHMFVIEEKLEDGYARQVWARKRKLALSDIGIDPYGEFPSEGVWDWFADVSEHRGPCCGLAMEAGYHCGGVYREPDKRDLDNVAQKIYERRLRSQYKYREDQMAADMLRSAQDYEDKETLEAMAEAREIQRLAYRSVAKPAIYLDSSKRRV